ncbi:MAG TPA: hypothetical protein VK184_07075 [Nostocaceae cyanobacterium]|nr:hypothetical protein [Nostocaceae cyanobacterium]
MQRTIFVKAATIFLCSLASLGIVIGSFFLQRSTSSKSDLQIITDASRYREIRQKFGSEITQTQHFPATVSDHTQVIRFAYSDGIKQGNRFLQIRLKKSPAKIQELLNNYRKTAIRKYRGGDTNEHINFPNGVPTTFFYTSNSQIEAFPVSYEILVLNAQDKGIKNFKWNHGESSGVAIDVAASEIVYWAEKW